jgi:type II secretion system protein G
MSKNTFSGARHGFTLIELLIVVAIIAILAAIAVPNFLEAQTRSKVSRTKADIRTSATALEAYRVDNNSYPPCHPFGIALSLNGWDPTATSGQNVNNLGILERLSTPIAYVTSALVRDPFSVKFRVTGTSGADIAASTPIEVPATDAAGRYNSYIYQSWDQLGRAENAGPRKAQAWLLHSAGPDLTYHNLGGVLANERLPGDLQSTIQLMYDPTNGTISFGSIYRTGGGVGASPSYAAGEALVRAIQISQN